MKITITRRDGQGNKSEYQKRRKKGEFQQSFLKLHNTLTKNNKKTNENEEHDKVEKDKLNHFKQSTRCETDNIEIHNNKTNNTQDNPFKK